MKKVLAIMIILVLATAAFADSIFSMRAAGAFDLVSAKTPPSATTRPSYAADFNNTVINTPGFGFDVGMDLMLGDTIGLYGDFSMTFPSKVSLGDSTYTRSQLEDVVEKEKSDCESGIDIPDVGTNIKFKDIKSNVFLTTVSAHLGFSKAINTGDNPFRVALGGGVGYTRNSTGYRMTMIRVESDGKLYHMDDYEVFSTLSLDMYINAEYKMGNHFSVGAVLMPGFVFFNSSKAYSTALPTDTASYPVDDSTYYSTDSEKRNGMKPVYENSGFTTGFSLNTAIGITYHF